MNVKRITAIAGITAALGLGLAACSSSATGFHDMSTLETSVTQQANQGAANSGISGRVSQDVCVSTGANTATCAIQSDDGSGTSIHVVIAADGNSWASS